MATALDFSPTLDKVLLIQAVNEVAMPGDMLGPEFMPVVPYDSTLIEYDIVMAASGLLKALDMDEDIPTSRTPGVATIRMEAPVFRGNYPIFESMLKRLREPGTREQGQTLQEITARAANWLSLRADNTVEWTRWQVWTDGTLAVLFDDGQTTTVDYRMPPALNTTLTGTSQWDDYTNSDPLDDILQHIERLGEFGTEAGRIVYGWRVNRYLLQNAKIRTLIQAQSGADLLAAGVIPQGTLAGLPHQVYRKSYQAIDGVGAAYTSGTSLTLEDGDVGQLSELSNGDRIVLGPSSNSSNPGAKESQTVTGAPSGTTVTLSAALTLDFDIGDPVTWHRSFCHPDDFFIFPADDGELWCEWWNVPSVHNDNQTGKYATAKIVIDDIPFRGFVKGGIDGLPIIYRQGRHVRIKTT